MWLQKGKWISENDYVWDFLDDTSFFVFVHFESINSFTKSCLVMILYHLIFYLLGDRWIFGGTSFHREHHWGRVAQSPPEIFWQPAASSVIMAAGGKGQGQNSVTRRRFWSDPQSTHKSAHYAPAPHRCHGGRPWQVRLQTTITTDSQRYVCWFILLLQ